MTFAGATATLETDSVIPRDVVGSPAPLCADPGGKDPVPAPGINKKSEYEIPRSA